jgi:hypothetical protein
LGASKEQLVEKAGAPVIDSGAEHFRVFFDDALDLVAAG